MSADRTYHKHILVSVNVSSNPLAFRIAELLIWVFAETSGDVDKYKRWNSFICRLDYVWKDGGFNAASDKE